MVVDGDGAPVLEAPPVVDPVTLAQTTSRNAMAFCFSSAVQLAVMQASATSWKGLLVHTHVTLVL